MSTHEVWVELGSGTRAIVGRDLGDAELASGIARLWRERAQNHPDEMFETMMGSGCLIRAGAIVAIKAQSQKPTTTMLRDSNWL